MIRMEGQGRQAASQQIEASRRQAVGKMLRIIEEDFIAATILQDPYSPYGGLTTEWVDGSVAPATRAERMENLWIPLMKEGGLPIEPVLRMDFPEVVAQLEAEGIDPKDLLSPAIMVAMLKQGRGPATPTEEIVEGEEEEE